LYYEGVSFIRATTIYERVERRGNPNLFIPATESLRRAIMAWHGVFYFSLTEGR